MSAYYYLIKFAVTPRRSAFTIYYCNTSGSEVFVSKKKINNTTEDNLVSAYTIVREALECCYVRKEFSATPQINILSHNGRLIGKMAVNVNDTTGHPEKIKVNEYIRKWEQLDKAIHFGSCNAHACRDAILMCEPTYNELDNTTSVKSEANTNTNAPPVKSEVITTAHVPYLAALQTAILAYNQGNPRDQQHLLDIILAATQLLLKATF